MKIKYALLFGCALFTILLVFPVYGQDKNTTGDASKEQSDAPTKQETIDFIKSKLEGNTATYEESKISVQKALQGNTKGSVITSKYNYKYQLKISDVSVDGCTLNYNLQRLQLLETSVIDGPGVKENERQDKFEPIGGKMPRNLSKLDPASIRVEPLVFGTFGGNYRSVLDEKGITDTKETNTVTDAWVLVLDDSVGKDYSPALPNTSISFFPNNLLFQDKETAKRVSRAVKHLVTLCGGKVEPF